MVNTKASGSSKGTGGEVAAPVVERLVLHAPTPVLTLSPENGRQFQCSLCREQW